MMRKLGILSFLLAFTLSVQLSGQAKEYWVYFQEKDHAAEWILNGQLAIGERALESRFQRGISLDAKDVAVNPKHNQELKNMGAELVGSSRWMNATVVSWNGSPLEIEQLPFVKKVEAVRFLHSELCEIQGTNSLDYGNSRQQTELMGGQYIHDQGFTGQGVRIAVIDAGFGNANIMNTFDSLYTDGRLIDTYDFVHGDTNVFDGGGTHGTAVLSTMAALKPDTLVGTAPHAEYALYTTEDVSSESRQEEYNWIFGAERADSLGCDVINTSLGYYVFDDPNEDYAFEDMDGATTIVTRGADIAASKGIIVVASAGNEGFGSWGRIIAPCDGDSVFCIGGVNPLGIYVPFSSRGPSADGRVKPNVVAVGAAAMVANGSDVPTPANGTSFSSPIMAGMMACIRQKYPNKNNWEIMKAVEEVSDNHWSPDSLTGHGLPNFQHIDAILSSDEPVYYPMEISVYPNPSNGVVHVECEDCQEGFSWSVLDLSARVLAEGEGQSGEKMEFNFPNGVYMIRIQTDRGIAFKRIIRR
jgi:hypothetical protein